MFWVKGIGSAGRGMSKHWCDLFHCDVTCQIGTKISQLISLPWLAMLYQENLVNRCLCTRCIIAYHKSAKSCLHSSLITITKTLFQGLLIYCATITSFTFCNIFMYDLLWSHLSMLCDAYSTYMYWVLKLCKWVESAWISFIPFVGTPESNNSNVLLVIAIAFLWLSPS